MTIIKHVCAREVLDSRGNPTVEADVVLTSGVIGRGCAPSGSSTGSREAWELRDGDDSRYLGKGVLKAVAAVNDLLGPRLVGSNAIEQRQVDQAMCDLDGTDNKSKFGANAILAISIANARAAAAHQKIPLYQYISELNGTSGQYTMPVPMMNILNGGGHADNNVDIQEFMIVPVGASSFSEALRMGVEVFHTLKKVLLLAGLNTSVGDEGGFAPNLSSNDEALSIIEGAVKKAGYQLGQDIYLAMDCAASEFYMDGKYVLKSDNRSFTSQEFTGYLESLVKRYPIISIEDGLDESDWEGFAYQTKVFNKKIQIVGDDLFVTNTTLLQQGVDQGVANAILIKPNQIGTLSETFDAIRLAQKSGYNTVISHRSGETEDVTIADLAVGMKAGQIKTGSLCRSDRMAKYNQLLRIEEELGGNVKYLGAEEFSFL